MQLYINSFGSLDAANMVHDNLFITDFIATYIIFKLGNIVAFFIAKFSKKRILKDRSICIFVCLRVCLIWAIVLFSFKYSGVKFVI